MSYVNYEFYTSHFSKLSESNFNKRIDEAESFINTMGRINVINDLKNNELLEVADIRILPYKLAICKVAEKQHELEGAADNLTSISNNGYSESYAVSNKTEIVSSLARNSLAGTGIWGVQYV